MDGHAFISYVREDSAAVDRLVDYLEAAGIPVWRDTSSLAPGDRWEPTLRQAISNGALAFIACFSEHSRTKEKSWQRKELLWAVDELQLRSPNQRWLIPVRLGDCKLEEMPIGGGQTLNAFQWVDVFGDRWEEGAGKLVQVVLQILAENGRASAGRVTGAGLHDVPEQAIARRAVGSLRWPDRLPRTLRHRLSDHRGWVRTVCAVPVGGRLLVASTSHSSVRLWDPVTGQLHREIETEFGMVHAAGIVPLDDQVLLATGDGEHGIQLWDPATGHPHGAPMKGHTDNVLSVCTLTVEDRLLLASGSNYMDQTIRLWDVATGEQVGEPMTGHDATVRTVCTVVVEGRDLLATGGGDGNVRLWDPAAGAPVGEPLGDLEPDTAVLDVCVVPVDERTLLATANADGTVRLWDPTAGVAQGLPLRGHAGPVLAVCPLPVGDRVLLASAGKGGVVRLWDPAAGAPVGEPFVGLGGQVNSLCALRVGDEMLLASAGMDGTVGVWRPDATDGRAAQPAGHAIRPVRHPVDEIIRDSAGRIPWPDELPQREWSTLVSDLQGLRTVCAVQAGDRMLLATAGTEREVQLWDPATQRAHGEPLVGHTGGFGGLCAVRVRGRMLLASGDRVAATEGTLRLWDPATATPHGWPIITGPVQQMCAVPRSRTEDVLATADFDGKVWLWDPATGEPHGPSLQHHGTEVTAMCVVPVRGHTLLATASLGGIALSDPATGEIMDILLRRGILRRAQPAGILGMCAVPVGSRMLLATAGHDATVRLWDPASGRTIAGPLVGHTAPVRAVCTLPVGDGALVASGGDDQVLRLWDPADGVAVGEPLEGHTEAVTGVCAVPVRDQMLLASAAHDGSLRLWGPRR